MHKEIYVVFTPTNARIVIDPEEPTLFEGREDVLKNPDLSAVKNVPPHFWKKLNNRIVSMTEMEKKLRQKTIDENVSHFPVMNDLISQVDHFKKVIDSLQAELAGIEEKHQGEQNTLVGHHLKDRAQADLVHAQALRDQAVVMNNQTLLWKKCFILLLPLVLIFSLYLGHFIK